MPPIHLFSSVYTYRIVSDVCKLIEVLKSLSYFSMYIYRIFHCVISNNLMVMDKQYYIPAECNAHDWHCITNFLTLQI